MHISGSIKDADTKFGTWIFWDVSEIEMIKTKKFNNLAEVCGFYKIRFHLSASTGTN